MKLVQAAASFACTGIRRSCKVLVLVVFVVVLIVLLLRSVVKLVFSQGG
jgi:hypothetical protein